MAKILLAGLDPETANEFSGKLTQLGYQSEAAGYESRAFESGRTSYDADVIFASDDDVRCLALLSRIRRETPSQAFVIVSRVAEDERWLAALEAGATDYCTSGINLENLSWILKNASAPLANSRAMTCAA